MAQISDGGQGGLPTSGGSTGTLPPFTLTPTGAPAPTGGPTSGGGGSSGGSGSAGSSARLASLRSLLRSWGLPQSLAGTLLNAMKGGADPVETLYGRPEFKTKFQGIFRKDGSLIMSPQEYLQYQDSAQALARRYGVSLTAQQVGQLVGGSVSAEELKFRFEAANTVKTHSEVFAAYNVVAKASGLPQIKSQQDAFKFVTGTAPKAMYEAYETAYGLAAAKGTGTDTEIAGLSTGQIRRDILQSGGVLGLDELNQKYGNVADLLRRYGPELKASGFTQGHLRIAEFGGPNQQAIIAQIKQVLANRDANLQGEKASQQIGLQGNRIVSGYQEEAGL